MWGQYLPVFSVLNGNSWEYVQNFENLFLPFIFSWWAKFSARVSEVNGVACCESLFLLSSQD